MNTIYKKDSKLNTRVIFLKDSDGLTGAFLKQGVGHNEQVLNCNWFKTETKAIEWANKQVL